MLLSKQQLAEMIDISAVKTEVTLAEIKNMVEIAQKYKFICVFPMPCYIPHVKEMLKPTPEILLGGVVGFPSGAVSTQMKIQDAKWLVSNGCDEIDMVINVGMLRSGLFTEVENDIRSVVDAAGGLPTKVILEVAYLDDEQIKRGCEIIAKTGAAFVKTGTGWAPKVTTPEHISLIKSVVGDRLKIKAAAGVRDLATLLEMYKRGACRFGISMVSAEKIMNEWDQWEKQ